MRHQLEVMDQRLHRLLHDVADVGLGVPDPVGAHLQLRRPAHLVVLDHHGSRFALQPRQGLLDDPQRLAHLLHPDLVPGERVGVRGRGDVELVGLIAAVRFVDPDVPHDAGRTTLPGGVGPAAATGVLWGLSYFFWRRMRVTPASA